MARFRRIIRLKEARMRGVATRPGFEGRRRKNKLPSRGHLWMAIIPIEKHEVDGTKGLIKCLESVWQISLPLHALLFL
jgi:hypothetical protein